MVENSAETADPIVIKKYANRRLYDTTNASFVTLDDLHQMVKDGIGFVVRGAKSGRGTCRRPTFRIAARLWCAHAAPRTPISG